VFLISFSWLIINFSKKLSLFSSKKHLETIGLPLITSIALVTLLVTPATSHAWFFSSASAQSEPVYQSVISTDSAQNMPLLSAEVAMMSDLKPVDTDADIQIVDGEAIIADMGSSGTLADLVDIPTTDKISTYVVQPGDTVAKVAKKFGVSENTVRWANGLSKKDVLQRGQNLVILPITGVKHKVQKGETIQSIAKKYKVGVTDITDYNDLVESDILRQGDVLIIPDGEIVTVSTPTKTAKVVPGSGVKKTGVPSSKGYYIQPVVPDGGRIRKTQGFHTRYNAIDVGAPVGTPIRAMADGTVIVTKSPNGYNGGYGGLTIITHANGSQTLYAHQSKISVSSGERVSQGQIIGYTGNTGKSTGPHLHYEIRGVYPTPVLY
jgi:murein DD-endopeptidase MepM/ murein hydrolase activator NlpD